MKQAPPPLPSQHRERFEDVCAEPIRLVHGVPKLLEVTPLVKVAVGEAELEHFARPPGYVGTRQLRVVSVYAQKGGVGKTTLTGMMGWELARRGKRVLLVDADPQCNLTEWFVPQFEEFVEAESEGEPYDSMQTYIDTWRLNKVADARHLRCVPVEVDDRDKTEGGALFVLCGNNNLTTAEFDLHSALTTAAANPYQQNELMGFLVHGLRATGWAYDVDYIIIDMNPSGGLFNELLVMTSDRLIIPANPSAFSVQGFKSTQKRLFQSWRERYQTQVKIVNSTNPLFRLPMLLPKFQGVIVNQFRPANKKPAQAYADFIERLRKAVDEFSVTLTKSGFTANTPALSDEAADQVGPSLPALDSHGQWAQYHHRPPSALKVCHFTSADGGLRPSGDRLNSAKEKVRRLKTCTRKFVNFLFPEAAQKVPSLGSIIVEDE